jgi:Fic family protein
MAFVRTYEKTHPWISFHLDLTRLHWSGWLLLGEAQSKCEHIAGVPLEPEVAKRLHRVYLAKGVHATTAIEGNTLTEGDVLQQMDGKLDVPTSKRYLQQEIQNILDACNDTLNACIAQEREHRLSLELLKDYNRKVLRGVPLPAEVVPGELRKYSVGVGRYRGAPPEDVAYLLEQLCTWLGRDELNVGGDAGLAFAIIRAVLAHLYLAWIHPFGDGNGRTARLAEFYILLCAGVPTPAAHLLSNHYNETRTEYYRQLEQASASGGDVMPFIRYAVQGFVDGLRKQLGEVREQQLEVAWRNYVYAQTKGRSAAHERRRNLVLDLTKHGPADLEELAGLSPRLAVAYASKTAKTLSRDLNTLQTMGLIVKREQRWCANADIIRAYLPLRLPSEKPTVGGDPQKTP